MGYIGLSIFILIIGIAAYLIIPGMVKRDTERNHQRERRHSGEDPDDYRYSTYGLKLTIATVAIGLWVLLSAALSIHQVSNGHVGLVYTFGRITGQTTDGLVFTAPWQDVKSANIQTQTVVFDQIAAGSEDTQDVFVRASVSYSVAPKDIQQLYRTVGPDYYEKLVRGRVEQYFKDEVVKYDAIDATKQRVAISSAVRDRLATELAPYSIAITALVTENISYSDAFNSAIEAKQVQTQKTLEEIERTKQIDEQQKQKVSAATGDAEAVRVNAAGQADANRLLSASITPELIQFQAVQKLSDKITIALVPSGAGLLVDPATLIGQQP